jgi:hypothetical protein
LKPPPPLRRQRVGMPVAKCSELAPNPRFFGWGLVGGGTNKVKFQPIKWGDYDNQVCIEFMKYIYIICIYLYINIFALHGDKLEKMECINQRLLVGGSSPLDKVLVNQTKSSTRGWTIKTKYVLEYNEHKVWMKPNPKTEDIPGDSIVAVFSGKGF